MINPNIRVKQPFSNFKQCSKVIIDVDTGCDDAQALVTLIHLSRKYKKEILGITCTYGNTTLNNVVINTLITTKLCGAKIKIYKGNTKSLLGQHHQDNYFKQDGFNNHQKQYINELTQQDYALVQEQKAYSFISRATRQYKNDVAIILTAPATNLAIAFLNDSQIPKNIGSLTVMGGSTSGIGVNQTFSAQFNFNGDPQAIYIVLKQFQNIVVVTLDQAYDFKSSKQYFNHNQTRRGGLVKNLFSGIEYFVCDPLTLFPVFVPQSVKSVYNVYGQIVLEGSRTKGYLAIDWMGKGKRPNNISIIAQLDEGLINKELLQAVIDN